MIGQTARRLHEDEFELEMRSWSRSSLDSARRWAIPEGPPFLWEASGSSGGGHNRKTGDVIIEQRVWELMFLQGVHGSQ